MAITFNSIGTAVTGANPTVTLPATYSAGDLLLICNSVTGSDFTTPSGWSRATSAATVPDSIVFYKFAGSSESNVTLSGGGAASVSVMLSYSYVDDFDQATAKSNLTASSITAQTLSVNNNDSLILYLFTSGPSTGNSFTAPASTNTRLNRAPTSSTSGLLICDEIFTGTGTTTSRTATYSTSANLSTRTASFTANRGYFFGAL